MASSSQTVKDNFEKNKFSVTRQIRYNLENTREEIDMVVFINGLAIATLELKKPMDRAKRQISWYQTIQIR